LIVGREDFDAIDNVQALAIVAAIFEACSDVACSYELWNSKEQVLSPQGAASEVSEPLSDYQRQRVVETATALRDSNWLIAESKKLIREIEALGDSSTASKADALTVDPANAFESFVTDIESPHLRAIAEHWNDVRGERAMPSWDDLSSSALAPHFKLLWGYQFDRQRCEFTGKLAGTHIRQWLGPKFCRAKLEDIHPPHVVTEARAFLDRVVTTPGLGLCSGRLFTVGTHTVTGERLALPLATDGISADGVLGVSDYVYPSVSGPVALIHENIEWCAISKDGEARS
jgi:hypothetical protein